MRRTINGHDQSSAQRTICTGSYSAAWARICPLVIAIVSVSGCATVPGSNKPVNRVALKHRAIRTLEAAIQYPHNPVVRIAGVEAVAESECTELLPMLRTALLDDHPAVRFAACVALGDLKDLSSLQSIRRRLADSDAHVQAGAIYAMHRMGDSTQTGRLSALLLEYGEIPVRRNAAMLLGKLGETSAIKVLAKAMGDEDEGVQHQALEAMAKLGNDEACNELAFLSNSGVGSIEVFAIQALAYTGRREYIEPFRHKLRSSEHLEVRLAAALGLEQLGQRGAHRFAMRALQERRPLNDDPNDPVAEQIMRGRLMAADVLGASGQTEALPTLARLINDQSDPRVQVAGAQAILKILNVSHERALPFESKSN